MPIREYLDQDISAAEAPAEHHAFDPEAIAIMSRALEAACVALQLRTGDTPERRIIATRIIDLARSGVIDANALRDRVLLEAKS